jgi:hypothetical protein
MLEPFSKRIGDRSPIMLRDGVEELGEVQAVLLFRLVRWV